MSVEQRKAVYLVQGQKIIYSKKDSYSGSLLTNTLGVYEFEFRTDSEWTEFDKVALYLQATGVQPIYIELTDTAIATCTTGADGNKIYKVPVPEQMLTKAGQLTVGLIGYYSNQDDFRFPTNTDSSYRIAASVQPLDGKQYPQYISIMEQILLRLYKGQGGSTEDLTELRRQVAELNQLLVKNGDGTQFLGNDGNYHTVTGYDDTSVKASINSIEDLLNGTSSGSEETSIKGTEFSSFQGIESGSSLTLTASSSFTAFSHGKNYLPFSIGSYDNNLTTVSEDSESITLQIKGGNTFKHFKLSPIFLKAGTYTVSLTTTKVSGDDIANAGVMYVFTGDTQETQGTQLKVGKSPTTITLDADKWVMLDVYMNTNSSFTNDTVYKFSNFQIEKSSSFTSYEKYSGTSKTGTSVSFAYTSGMEIYTTTEVILKYTKTGSQLSMSYAQVLEAVASIETSSNPKTVVAYGDSLTSGTGNDVGKPSSESNSDNSYPAVLGRKLGSGYTVINAGVGGEPSWMIAARQGGMPVEVLPATIPATKTSVRVYLKGMEQDAYYNKDTSKWTYLENALSYNIAVDGNANINPVKINGIEGTLTRVLLTSGSSDPTTGETVQSNTYAYYFTRSTAGEASTFTTPKTLITYASENYKDAISIIWAGQNDAPLINGKYFTQVGTEKRIRRMVEHGSDKYIIMQVPSSSDEKDINNDQAYVQEFGEHYINIRKFICTHCIELCKSLGYEFTRDTANTYYSSSEADPTYATVGDSLDAGVIPRVLRKDGVHGNYYYYQIVAIAVYERGKDLGYWN